MLYPTVFHELEFRRPGNQSLRPGMLSVAMALQPAMVTTTRAQLSRTCPPPLLMLLDLRANTREANDHADNIQAHIGLTRCRQLRQLAFVRGIDLNDTMLRPDNALQRLQDRVSADPDWTLEHCRVAWQGAAADFAGNAYRDGTLQVFDDNEYIAPALV